MVDIVSPTSTAVHSTTMLHFLSLTPNFSWVYGLGEVTGNRFNGFLPTADVRETVETVSSPLKPANTSLK
jgi:hypothetical protein